MATITISPAQDAAEIIRTAPLNSLFRFQTGMHRLARPLPVRTGDSFEGATRDGVRLATLTGARVLLNWRRDGRRWWVGGQTQQGTIPPVGDVCRPGSPMCDRPEDLFMDNTLRRHVATLDEVGPGTWHFNYGANRIYVGDNPHGHLVETSVLPQLFQGESAASRILMEDLIIEKFASPTAHAAVNLGDSARGGADWEIRQCEIRWNHGGAVWNDTATATRECYIHHNGEFGCQGAGAGIVLEGNEVCYNNTLGYNSYWGAGGSKWVWTTGMIVRGNFFHNNDGPGIWFDINNIDGLIEDNLCEDNQLPGIFWEIGYAAVIRNNVCRRNGRDHTYPGWPTSAEIFVSGSSNVEVYHNTVEGNSQGITGLDDHRGDGRHGPWTLRNLRVYENQIIVHPPVDAGWGLTGVVDSQGADGGAFSPEANNRYERNVYTAPQGFMWNNQILDWAGWQAAGQDLQGSITP